MQFAYRGDNYVINIYAAKYILKYSYQDRPVCQIIRIQQLIESLVDVHMVYLC